MDLPKNIDRFFLYLYLFKTGIMKLKLYFLFFLFFVTLVSFSQEFKGGILAGLAASEISGDYLEGPNKAGVYAGAFVNRHFTPKSSLQLELDFIQKGSRENPDSTNDYRSYLLRLNYVEMPVHYKFDLSKRSTLEGGLSLGVLIHSYEAVNTYEWVAGSDFDPFDLSLNIGYYFSLLEKLSINVRYSNSIVPVRPHAGGATWRANKGQYNEVLSFVLFYEL